MTMWRYCSMQIFVYKRIFPSFMRNGLYNIVIFLRNLFAPERITQQYDNEVYEELNSNGYVALGSFPPEKLCRINEHLASIKGKPLYDNSGRIAKEVYDQSDLITCAEICDFAFDGKVLSALDKYFGCLPQIQFITAWKTYSNDHELAEMHFHMDHHGHRFAKLFLYLTDVAEGDGHHEYIRGSHRLLHFVRSLKTANLRRAQSQILAKMKYKGDFLVNNDVLEDYLGDKIVRVTHAAGGSFLEDTSGLHRGTKISSGTTRTILQVLYTPFDSGKDPVNKQKIENDTMKVCCDAASLSTSQVEYILKPIKL